MVLAPCLFLSSRPNGPWDHSSWVSAEGWVPAGARTCQGLVIASESGGIILPKSHPHRTAVADPSAGCFKHFLFANPPSAWARNDHLPSRPLLLRPAATSLRCVPVPEMCPRPRLWECPLFTVTQKPPASPPINPGAMMLGTVPADCHFPACKS